MLSGCELLPPECYRNCQAQTPILMRETCGDVWIQTRTIRLLVRACRKSGDMFFWRMDVNCSVSKLYSPQTSFFSFSALRRWAEKLISDTAQMPRSARSPLWGRKRWHIPKRSISVPLLARAHQLGGEGSSNHAVLFPSICSPHSRFTQCKSAALPPHR